MLITTRTHHRECLRQRRLDVHVQHVFLPRRQGGNGQPSESGVPHFA